jgi:hypothetical protein
VNTVLAVVLAAAPPSALDQLRAVPKQTWINLAICVIAVIAIVKLWKGLRAINEFVPYIAAVLAGFLILFYWVYERAEPRFLTPVVEQLAHFFPTKGRQQQLIEDQRRSRDR